MPDSQPPNIAFQEQLGGVGSLLVRGESVPLTRFVLQRDKYSTSSEWSIEAHVAKADEQHCTRLLHHRVPPTIEGTIANGRSLRLPEVWWRHWGGCELEATAREVILDFQDLPVTPERQWLTMELSPTDLATPEKSFLVRSYTGEIHADDGVATVNERVEWGTSIGLARLEEHYAYEDIDVAGRRSLARIPVPVIHVPIEPARVSTSPLTLARTFSEETASFLRLISFLSRRHVAWLKMQVTSQYRHADSTQYHELQLLRSGFLQERPKRVERLVNPYRMKPGDVAAVSNALMASPYRDVILSAMEYTPSASQASFVESAVLFAFTALETLASGVHLVDGTHRSLGQGALKRLTRTLRATIESFAASEGVDRLATTSLLAKLPELNRPPIADQLERLLNKHQVEWKDLWFPGTTLGDAIRDMYGRRNAFLHAGVLGSIAQASIDAVRATTLAERLICSLCSINTDWIDSDSDRHLQYLPHEKAVIRGDLTAD